MTEPTREQIDESSVQDPAREAAFKAVFAVIAAIPSRAATEYEQACENGRVWRGVEAALDAFELAQRPSIVPQVLYDNAIQLRNEARDQVRVLEERIRKVREALHIADAEDHTDWQRGYRAAVDRVQAVLDGEGEKTDVDHV